MSVDTIGSAEQTPDHEQPWAELGLREDEYQRIRQILSRYPKHWTGLMILIKPGLPYLRHRFGTHQLELESTCTSMQPTLAEGSRRRLCLRRSARDLEVYSWEALRV